MNLNQLRAGALRYSLSTRRYFSDGGSVQAAAAPGAALGGAAAAAAVAGVAQGAAGGGAAQVGQPPQLEAPVRSLRAASFGRRAYACGSHYGPTNLAAGCQACWVHVVVQSLAALEGDAARFAAELEERERFARPGGSGRLLY